MNRTRTTIASLAAAALSVGFFAAPAFAEAPAVAPVVTAEIGDPEGYLGWPVTGQGVIEHPGFGRVDVRTVLDAEQRRSAFVVVQGATVLWAQEFTDLSAFALASPAQDATGNVFINYDPGRHNGLVVLRPTQNGFTILAHSYDRLAEGLPFYEAHLLAPGADGRASIETRTNDCTPSCVAGTVFTQTWSWVDNSSTYIVDPQHEAPPPAPKVRPTAKPKAQPKATAKPAPKATPKPTASAASAAAKPTPEPKRAEAAPAPAKAAAPVVATVPAPADSSSTTPIIPLAAGSLLAVGSAGWLVGRARRP